MKRHCVKFISRLKERLKISKRQLFVTVTLLMTFELISTQLFIGGLQIKILLLLGISAYVLSAFALREELRGWEFMTLLILPTFYTIAVFLFYFLLPTRWLTRLPIAVLYALGMYAILLTENIYNVAAQRNIQLLRAAHSVGFLLTLVTLFFLVDTILSLHLPFYFNLLSGIVVVLPLTFQALWSIELTPQISSNTWLGTLVSTALISQLILVFSFWPIRATIEALFITTVFYSLVGMFQQYLIERLFFKTIREYVTVMLLVFILVLITTKWGTGIR